jgi:predicted RNA-binding protein associated with RNAse of E/G family
MERTYININTPVEIYPEAIRYIDLEVDVCIRPNGETKIVDKEKLEKALEKGFVSKTLFEKVESAVKAVAEKVLLKSFWLNLFSVLGLFSSQERDEVEG